MIGSTSVTGRTASWRASSALERPARAQRSLLLAWGNLVWRLACFHEGAFKPHLVEQAFDGGALGIGAASPYIPVAMRVRLPVAHDDLADGLAPSLGGAAILPDETCYQQVFEIGCRHTRRIAARVDYSNTVRALGPAPESV